MFTLIFLTLKSLAKARILILILIPPLIAFAIVALLLLIFWLVISINLNNFDLYSLPALFSDWLLKNLWFINSIPFIGNVIGTVFLSILNSLTALLAKIIIFYSTIFLGLLITGFIGIYIIKAIQKEFYPSIKELQGNLNNLTFILRFSWFIVTFAFIFIISLPFFIIPYLGNMWGWLLGFIFFRYSILFETGRTIVSKEVFFFEKNLFNFNITLPMVGLFVLSYFIPFSGFIILPLSYILLSHHFLRILEKKISK